MERTEYLAWAKARALAYVEAGDLDNALISIVSDLGKHAELQGHLGIDLGLQLKLAGHLRTAAQVRAWIEGLN